VALADNGKCRAPQKLWEGNGQPTSFDESPVTIAAIYTSTTSISHDSSAWYRFMACELNRTDVIRC